MQTKMSIKGEIVVPGSLCRKLGIRPGDPLEARIEAGRIVLTPQKRRSRKAKLITDPITGLPVLSSGLDSPILTSKEIQEILAGFP